MKRFLLFAALLTILHLPSFSQGDTTVRYLSKTGKETTKDSAFSFAKFYKHSDQWRAAEYYMQKGALKSEGNYAQPNFDTPVGSFNNYKEDGKLDFTSEYVDGRLLEKIYYYKNGDKRSWIHYSDKEPPLQKGWDESGKEIKNYIVEREAMFKGGPEAWKRYLAKNVDPNLAVNVGAPAGNYEVQLQFVISTEGYPSNVKVVSAPPKCKPCASEAARVVREAPAWEPALHNNQPVIYQATQNFTFQVAGESKKG